MESTKLLIMNFIKTFIRSLLGKESEPMLVYSWITVLALIVFIICLVKTIIMYQNNIL